MYHSGCVFIMFIFSLQGNVKKLLDKSSEESPSNPRNMQQQIDIPMQNQGTSQKANKEQRRHSRDAHYDAAKQTRKHLKKLGIDFDNMAPEQQSVL